MSSVSGTSVQSRRAERGTSVARATLARLPGTPSLQSNATWSLIGNGVYAACQWGMLVVIAKLAPAESVGQFALGLAVTAPVVMFANLQLRAVQSTDMSGQYAFGQYLRLRFFTSTLALAVISAIVLISGYRGETAYIILGIGGLKAVESMSDLLYGRMQQREDMYGIARSLMLRGLGALALLLCVVLLTGQLLAGIVAMIIWWAAVLVLHDVVAVSGGLPEEVTNRGQTNHGQSTIWDLVC
ncbi:MAG: hypothetical protein QOK27_1868, partial [Gemmatimonadales bacterium]|nr:hypothetical protein [Gemmatimonadales bacterium]